MDTNCAPLVADLFLFCYERDFMTSLSDVKQAEIIEAFKSTSRYLDYHSEKYSFPFCIFCIIDSFFLINLLILLLIQGRSRGRIVTFFVGIHCLAIEIKVSEKCFAYSLTSTLYNESQLNSEIFCRRPS